QSHEITLGYRYLNETADEKAYRSGWYPTGSQSSRPQTDSYYQHTSGGTEAHAIYIDDTINVGNWTVIPGLRYENIKIHLDDGFRNQFRSKSYSEPLPALSVIYHIDDQWKLFANAGSSFGS
ncbi:TonB-dependent receptor, partial [Escherichia coli]|nr:TonB-dependent receptor [Escherichia coli]